MREGKFIDQNLERWESYAVEAKDADELAERFAALVDDLSYAKTFYPRSKTTVYLNALSARMFNSIYHNQKKDSGRLRKFFVYELPLIVRRHHKVLLFSLIFFCACVLIGVVSTMKDYNFVRAILGDGYVDMTESNINKGDPFGVYKDENKWGMFVAIMLNNLRVGLLNIVTGFTAGLGTLYFMFTNGVMIGSFHQMFFAKGLGFEAILSIWIHGTIELATIVLEGMAGLVLGRAFLFPATYTRIESMKRAGRDVAKMAISFIPFVILAALLEAYITRYTSMPIWMSMLILIGSGVLIIGYFVVYPILVAKRGYYLENGELKSEDDA